MSDKPDFISLTAQRLHGMPNGWRWAKVNSHNKPEDYILVEGGVLTVWKRGPRKGTPRWPVKLDSIWMRRGEINQVSDEWERETGQCHRCGGDGQESVGWNKETGRKLRECRRCKGSGKSPQGTT